MNNKKHQKSRKSNRWLIIISILVIVIAALVTYFIININNKPSTDDLSSESITSTEIPDQYVSENTDDNYVYDDPKIPVQNEPTGNDLSEVYSYFTSTEVINDTLVIRVLISQQLSSDTICTLNITSNSNLIKTLTAPIINNPSTASCEGFDIPISELPSGKLNLSLTITPNEKNINTIEKEISL